MSTQSDKPYDYKAEIGKALDQSNLPKSQLAKDVNNIFTGSNIPNDVIAGLTNAQNLGNSNAPNQPAQQATGSDVFSTAGFNPTVFAPTTAVSNPLAQLLEPLNSKSFSEASLSGVNGLGGALTALLNQTQNNDARNIAQTPVNFNSANMQAISGLLAQKQGKDVADLRARFGAAGGSSRGTPAAYAESELKAQQLPELQQALSAATTSDLQNQLSSKSLTLQSLLASDSNTSQNLSSLLNSFSTTRGQDLNNVQGNQQNQLGLINSIIAAAGGAGQQALGAEQLNSQNALTASGQSNDRLNILGQLFNQGAGINNQNNQFNANQFNDLTKFFTSSNQAGNEAQINRQFSGLQDILQSIMGLTGSGTPGGGANVNIGNSTAVGPSQMQQYAQLLGALGGLF